MEKKKPVTMELKPLVMFKAECFQANKNKNGSTVIFAVDVQQTDKGPAARSMATFQVPDQSVADNFTIGRTYTLYVGAAE